MCLWFIVLRVTAANIQKHIQYSRNSFIIWILFTVYWRIFSYSVFNSISLQCYVMLFCDVLFLLCCVVLCCVVLCCVVLFCVLCFCVINLFGLLVLFRFLFALFICFCHVDFYFSPILFCFCVILCYNILPLLHQAYSSLIF